MFIVVCCVLAGLIGTLVAAARIQDGTVAEFNIGFPSALGGLFGAFAATVVAYMLPVSFWWLTLVAVLVSAGFGFGGTYVAQPLAYSYMKRREIARSKNGGR